jgi:hypothetical protein
MRWCSLDGSFFGRVSWTDGCALLACSFCVWQWALPIPRCLRLSVSGVGQRLCRCWIGEYICVWSVRLSANLQSHSCTATENISDGKDRRRRREELSKTTGSDGAMLEWVLRHPGAKGTLQVGSVVFLSCPPDQNFSISLVSHVGTKKCGQYKTHLDARHCEKIVL